MRFKITVLLLVIFNYLPLSSMIEELKDNDDITDQLEHLPDEVVEFVLSFTAKEKTISRTLQRLAELRLVNKRLNNLCSDNTLTKLLISLHVHDNDYQVVLNKILFKAACSGNSALISLLEGCLLVRKKVKMASIICLDLRLSLFLKLIVKKKIL